jgi:hypothetical protein
MALRMQPPGHWLAALALTMPAFLSSNSATFWMFGSLVVPFVAFGAATGSGYRRLEAVAVAVGSGMLVATLGLHHAPVFVYALVCAIAMRPPDVRTACWRAATLFTLVVLTVSTHHWWPTLLVPLLVAATDEAVGRPRTQSPGVEVEERPPAYPEARYALVLAFFSCLLLLAAPWWHSRHHSAMPPAILAFATAVTGAVLAIRTVRADPARAGAALALSSVPIVLLGLYFLVATGGGLQIGN